MTSSDVLAAGSAAVKSSVFADLLWPAYCDHRRPQFCMLLESKKWNWHFRAYIQMVQFLLPSQLASKWILSAENRKGAIWENKIPPIIAVANWQSVKFVVGHIRVACWWWLFVRITSNSNWSLWFVLLMTIYRRERPLWEEIVEDMNGKHFEYCSKQKCSWLSLQLPTIIVFTVICSVLLSHFQVDRNCCRRSLFDLILLITFLKAVACWQLRCVLTCSSTDW